MHLFLMRASHIAKLYYRVNPGMDKSKKCGFLNKKQSRHQAGLFFPCLIMLDGRSCGPAGRKKRCRCSNNQISNEQNKQEN